MRYLLFTLFVCSLSFPAGAAIKTETVAYKHAGTPLIGYLAYDDALLTARPGVLVVHEWWGLNDYAKQRARELASLGYVAFAVDMYGKGESTSDRKRAGALAGALKKDPKLARARLAAGLKVLAAYGNVDPKRLAAIGYCFGGTMALQLAYSGAEVRGVVSFHGHLPPPGKGDKIKAKVLVCHGAADPHVPTKQVAEFQSAMDAGKVDYQLIAYGGAMHAFTNPLAKSPKGGADHHPRAERRSWQHMRDFLGEALTPAAEGPLSGVSHEARHAYDRLLAEPTGRFERTAAALMGTRPSKHMVSAFALVLLAIERSDKRLHVAVQALLAVCRSEIMIEHVQQVVEGRTKADTRMGADGLRAWLAKAAPRLKWNQKRKAFLDPEENR